MYSEPNNCGTLVHERPVNIPSIHLITLEGYILGTFNSLWSCASKDHGGGGPTQVNAIFVDRPGQSALKARYPGTPAEDTRSRGALTCSPCVVLGLAQGKWSPGRRLLRPHREGEMQVGNCTTV